MKSRRYDYDVLRVLSMLGVVYLHTAAGSLRSFSYHSLWNFSNLITVMVTPAVPLFFMMSGALLLSEEKTGDLGQLFRRRIPKVLVPLLCWSAVSLGYNFLRGDPQAALTSLSRLLNTPVLVPYWFLYALIPMYLISPLLKAMTDHLTDRQWDYMMALWAILTLGLYTVRSFVPDTWELVFTEHWTLNLNMIGGYLGYFLLGAYLERWEKLPSKKALAGAVIFLVAFAAVGTWWDTYDKMMYSDRFTNYLTLFTMALSVSIFLLAKSCRRATRSASTSFIPLSCGWVRSCGPASPGCLARPTSASRCFSTCASWWSVSSAPSCSLLSRRPVTSSPGRPGLRRARALISGPSFVKKSGIAVDKAGICGKISCVQGYDGAKRMTTPKARGDGESPRRKIRASHS